MSETLGIAAGAPPEALPPLTVTAPASAPSTSTSTSTSTSFRTLLSELNPLQYIPVVGTIYRAATGDTIPEGVRDAGSLLVSGLVGGPVGLATGVGVLAFEKMTGLDPDKIGTDLLASIGVGEGLESSGTPAVPVTADPGAPSQQAAAPSSPAAWSPAQLAAYGVTTTATGDLRHGDLRGADVLNDLVLARLHAAA